VDEMALLLGLLVFSYVGSALLAPEARAAMGLPSGSHFMVLGFLLGPHALGLVPSDAATSFGPLAIVASAWIALVLGTAYGYEGNRRLSARAFLVGFSVALSSAALIALMVYVIAAWALGMPEADARVVASGIGLAGCESARQGVRWVVERGASPGPLLSLLEEVADTDEIVPLLGLAALFAGVPSPLAQAPISYEGWLLVTLGLGLVLGLTSIMLLSGLRAASDAWSVLLGAALLGTGIAWRLSLSPLTTLFVMGVCVSLGSRHAAELRPLLARTEPGVLLPALLLAGALVRLPSSQDALWIIAAAVASRIVVRVLLGYLLARVANAAPRQRWPFGLGLSCTGTVSVLVGLTYAFRFPGALGELVLTVAAISGVLGDLLGSSALRVALAPPPIPEPASAS
jgi:Kef-type K+ transport system membrane component KefB